MSAVGLPMTGHIPNHLVPVGSLCLCPCEECTLRLTKGCICPDCPCEEDSDHAEPEDEREGAP